MNFSSTIRMSMALLLLATAAILGVGVYFLIRDTLDDGLRIEGTTVLQSVAGSMAWNLREHGSPGELQDLCALVSDGKLLDLRIDRLEPPEPLFLGSSCGGGGEPAAGVAVSYRESMPGLGVVEFSTRLSDAELKGLAAEVTEFLLWVLLCLLLLGWLLTSVFGRVLREGLQGFLALTPKKKSSEDQRVSLSEIRDLQLLDSIVRKSNGKSPDPVWMTVDALDVQHDAPGGFRVRRVALESRADSHCLLLRPCSGGVLVADVPTETSAFCEALSDSHALWDHAQFLPFVPDQDVQVHVCSDGSQLILQPITQGADRHV